MIENDGNNDEDLISNKIKSNTDELIKLTIELVEVKKENNEAKYNEIYNKILHIILELKSSNRNIHLTNELKRKQIEEEKLTINNLQLKLDNLLYKQDSLINNINNEKNYPTPNVNAIEKEINRLIGINSLVSNDKSIQIAEHVSVNQIYSLHNEAIEILNNEKIARENAAELLLQKQNEYNQLVELLDKKKKFLEDIPIKISSIKSTALELQSQFDRYIGNDNEI